MSEVVSEIAHPVATPVATRQCRACGDEKPVGEFHRIGPTRSGAAYLALDCKACRNVADRTKYAADKLLRFGLPVKPNHRGVTKVCKACGIAKTRAELSRAASRCKACIRASDEARNAPIRKCKTCEYVKPKEHFRSYIRPGAIVHGLQCIECYREYRKASYRNWKDKNLEKRSALSAAWYVANREKVSDNNAAWRAANPDRCRANSSRRRARNLGAPGSHTAEDIARIRKSQKDKCCMPFCHVKLKGGGHEDHRVSLKRGGSNSASNMQLLCGPCNLSKNARDEIEFVQSRNAPKVSGQLHLL